MFLKMLQSLLGQAAAPAPAGTGIVRTVAPVPAALDGYLMRIADGRFAGCYENELHLLNREGIGSLTAAMGLHPLVARLGGWILDDPCCSNFHVYLTVAPLAGNVLYLSHDGDSRVVFVSLAAFLDAAEACKGSELTLRDFHPVCAPPAVDQAALSRMIAVLSDSDDDDEAVLLALIPSIDAVASPQLERLARSNNFFVAEAAAILIETRPSVALWTMAQLCAHHPHPQASDAGKRALAAIGGPDVVSSYSERGEKRQPSFEVSYRFLTVEEGGRMLPPWQHTRWDFLYAQDDPQVDGIWMIWPEFIGEDRLPFPCGLVPSSGRALMFIVSPELASYHRTRIAIGAKGWMVEGGRRVAKCEVIAVHGLTS